VANLKIRGVSLDVDLTELLQEFDWEGARWDDEKKKLIARSPFRSDKHPSFFVNLDGEYVGTWGDSGTQESGNIVSLLAFLRGQTYEEAEEFLLETYATSYSWEEEKKPLSITLNENIDRYPDSSQYRKYLYRHPYLMESRSITEEIQRACYIGYDREQDAITIPWFDVNMRLGNVKLRSTNSKIFKYWKGAVPISRMVYNLNLAYKRGYTEAILCEAEIDAMTWMCYGKLGIATGGANVSLNQIELIVKSPLEKIYVANDHDEAGIKFLKKMYDALSPFKTAGIAKYPNKYKDINEAHVANDLKYDLVTIENKLKIFI
jgi:DNA primase